MSSRRAIASLVGATVVVLGIMFAAIQARGAEVCEPLGAVQQIIMEDKENFNVTLIDSTALRRYEKAAQKVLGVAFELEGGTDGIMIVGHVKDAEMVVVLEVDKNKCIVHRAFAPKALLDDILEAMQKVDDGTKA